MQRRRGVNWDPLISLAHTHPHFSLTHPPTHHQALCKIFSNYITNNVAALSMVIPPTNVVKAIQTLWEKDPSIKAAYARANEFVIQDTAD